MARGENTSSIFIIAFYDSITSFVLINDLNWTLERLKITVGDACSAEYGFTYTSGTCLHCSAYYFGGLKGQMTFSSVA